MALFSYPFSSLSVIGRIRNSLIFDQRHAWYLAAAFGIYTLANLRKQRHRLTRKHAIVLTGCDSGLGYSLAVHYHAKEEVAVIAGVLQVNSPGALDLVRREVKVLQLDVTDADSVRKFGDEVERTLQADQLQLHALVNNAGVMVFGESIWQLPQQIRSQFEVNALGAIAVTNRFIPLLWRHSASSGVRTRIVNVGSHCTLAPLPGLSAYSASKAALRAYSISLRVELRKHDIDVVTFIPGSLTKDSNIMANQKRHFDDMRAGVAVAGEDDKSRFYGDYYERFVAYLTPISKDNGLRVIDDPKVYETFDAALRDKSPSFDYICEPWRYKFYHFLFKIAPTRARDWLVEKFMLLPKWTSADEKRM